MFSEAAKPPTAAEAAQLGLSIEEALEAHHQQQHTDVLDVWPDNWPAVCLFEKVSTQWRIGPSGLPVGLDYGPLFRLLDRMDLRRDEWDTLFDDVRVCEDAALEKMREDRQQ